MIAGIGDPYLNDTHLGEYVVYGADGVSRNQTITDTSAWYTTGCYYNPVTQSLWTTNFDGLSVGEYDGASWVRHVDITPTNALAVESIAFDATNHFFVGLPYGDTPNMAEYTSTGTLVRTYTVPPPPDGETYANGAVDWIDADVDTTNNHRLIYYTDESLRDGVWHGAHPGYKASVYRYDVDTQTVTRFATIPDSAILFAVRVLPNHDGLLVTSPYRVYRLNNAGAVVGRYEVPGDYGLFSLNIAPDGTRFWTASSQTGNVYRFHIPSRQLELTIPTGSPVVNGLCVVREYTAIENTCTASDGTTVACPKLEVCGPSVDTNGDGIPDVAADDDGDGLTDRQDPDCGPPGPNRPPTAGLPNIPGPYSVTQPITLQMVGSDPDFDPITFVGVTIPAPFALSASGLLTGTPTAAGTYHFAFKTVDAFGLESGVAEFDIQVVGNQPPDCSHAVPSISSIWPPNGRMVPITVNGVTDPDPGNTVTITITAIAQDEPVNDRGDGYRQPDGRIDGATAFVRAERDGRSNGRVYRISFTASDGAASCSGNVFVGVPHDKRGAPAVAGSTWYDSLVVPPCSDPKHHRHSDWRPWDRHDRDDRPQGRRDNDGKKR